MPADQKPVARVRSLPSLLAAGLVLTLVGCATPAEQAAGLKPGSFVSLQCSTGRSFQARLAAEGESVRVRTQHGSAELSSAGNGVFKDGDFELDARPADGLRLMHKGKPEAGGCKA
jgi:hypothetical protein